VRGTFYQQSFFFTGSDPWGLTPDDEPSGAYVVYLVELFVMMKMQCRVALEDGTIVRGHSFGAQSTTPVTGEVVFNTAMCGYQESLTDPSYSGQILIMTAPEIGNYGVNNDDIESCKPQVAGFIVRELSRTVSNYRSNSDLSSWLSIHGIPAIEGVDTRALVRRIRSEGALRGVITTNSGLSDAHLVELAKGSKSMSGQELATLASCDEPETWTRNLEEWDMHTGFSANTWKVVALDCGVKDSIYKHLTSVGCEVLSLPNTATAEEILSHAPDGLFISNGPGDPSAVKSTISTLKQLAGTVPTFGICLGHQMLALALGATTWKLPFGHRGANHPIRDLETGKVEITSQNHGFCVDADSLAEADCIVTHRHLNDDTVAGFKHKTLPIMAVQFHPEASPGPHDSAYLFRRFVDLMQSHSSQIAQ
jgi:carbamoyl-phosphate synthase small subunit